MSWLTVAQLLCKSDGMSKPAPPKTDRAHRELLVHSICAAAAQIVVSTPNGATIAGDAIQRTSALFLPMLDLTPSENREIEAMLTGARLAFETAQPYLGDAAVLHLAQTAAAQLSDRDMQVLSCLIDGPLTPSDIRDRLADAGDGGVTPQSVSRVLSRLRLAGIVAEARHRRGTLQSVTSHGQAVLALRNGSGR